MHTLTGACSCGRSTVAITLSQPPGAYAPRICDCDFCTIRQLQYLSDPAGHIHINADSALLALRQGSAQAEFLACSHCQTVLAVCYREAALCTEALCIGAVNASLLDQRQLATAVTVSPKLLPAQSKTARWKQLWTPLVIEGKAVPVAE